jgi:hypothetical protein
MTKTQVRMSFVKMCHFAACHVRILTSLCSRAEFDNVRTRSVAFVAGCAAQMSMGQFWGDDGECSFSALHAA